MLNVVRITFASIVLTKVLCVIENEYRLMTELLHFSADFSFQIFVFIYVSMAGISLLRRQLVSSYFCSIRQMSKKLNSQYRTHVIDHHEQ